jgi:hypothetical protein
MREDFLRRYATSPIHVPRLERLLAAYGDNDEIHAFAEAFIAWDRTGPSVEAALVVAELLASFQDESGALVRLSDDAVRGALRLMAETSSVAPDARLRAMRTFFAATDTASIAAVSARLEAAVAAPAAALGALLR